MVLGWSEQVFTVVGELVAANANQRYGAVAVLAASQGSRDGPAGETGEPGDRGTVTEVRTKRCRASRRQD
ncbi:hypothetical protein [Streptomyces europaeiscabiei]|uniref:hypothetical protein n=1 Tax=Streptomyces europaeiscabiei TaxID=146819 RepID=UPI002E29C7AD|nr:hypothetical protein [Streptomyces europaeiscabiei]